MGVQLGERPQPSGHKATNYDVQRGLDGPQEVKREGSLLWLTAISFGLMAALAVAWGIRAYRMPANKVDVRLALTPPLDSQTALKLDGALISAPDGVLPGITLDKPHRLEVYQPHYIPLLHDFTVHRQTNEMYEVHAKLVPLTKE